MKFWNFIRELFVFNWLFGHHGHETPDYPNANNLQEYDPIDETSYPDDIDDYMDDMDEF